jgi:hypothetical protein
MMNDELSSLMQVKLEPPETLDLSKACHQRLGDQDVYSSQVGLTICAVKSIHNIMRMLRHMICDAL